MFRETPTAEIIIVGTELTTGAKLDTNSQWLSQQLSGIGIPVNFHTTVADDLEANVLVLRTAVERADVVLVTGGLGPTLDDLTRDAMAALLGAPLELHEPSLEQIRGMFARRQRAMPERNRVQAMFPRGSEPIPNDRGTAPGIWCECPRGIRPPAVVAALPGVPSEMKAMYLREVAPRLLQRFPARNVIRSRCIHSFGLGESQAEVLLGDLTARGRDPEIGITASSATITLRIEARASTADECEEKIRLARSAILERLGEYVFGEDDDELEDAVVRALTARGQTVAVAEAATGGQVLERLTSADAPRRVCLGGTVRHAQRLAAAGPDAVLDEARRIREELGADYGLAVGPRELHEGAAGAADPVPCCTIAWCGPAGGAAETVNLSGDPAIARARLVKSTLNLLRLRLR